MGIFSNPPSGFQNSKFWEWISQTVLNANGVVDALNKRIDAGGTSVQSDEVAGARIDLHGKVYGSLSTRTNALQSTAENALLAANSKADADVIEKYLSQLDYIPEVFATLDDLKNSYPDGKGGIFLVGENGYYYYYKNGWLQGPSAQNANIPNYVISSLPTYLGIDLVVLAKDSYYDGQGNIKAAAGYTAYQPVAIRPYTKYRVTATIANQAHIVLKDNQGNISTIAPSSSSNVYDINSDKYTSVLICSSSTAELFGLTEIVPNLSDYIRTGKSYKTNGSNIYISDNTDSNYWITEMIKPSEIKSMQIGYIGGKYVGIIFCNSMGKIVDFKIGTHGTNIKESDLSSPKEFDYVSFCSYSFDLIVNPGTPHRGYPNLSQDKTQLILEFDNSKPDFYQERFNLMKQYGFKFNFSIDSSFRMGISDSDNLALKELLKYGAEPMVYGGIGDNPSPAGDASQSDWENYVGVWLRWCNDNGLYSTVYAASHNDVPDNLAPVLKKYGFNFARTIAYWNEGEELISDINDGVFRLPTLQIDNTTENSLASTKSEIQKAISKGKSLSILAHLVGGTEDYQVSTADYTALLDYIKSLVNAGKVEVVTYSDLLVRQGGMATLAAYQTLSKKQNYILSNSLK